MTENDNPDPVAAFDQIGTTLENSAVVFGLYYEALLRNKLPPDLAFKMVSDMQLILFAKLIGGKSND